MKMHHNLANSIYKNSSQPIGNRVDDLLSRMTLEEKVGQLNTPLIPSHEDNVGRPVPKTISDCKKCIEGTFTNSPGPIGGFMHLVDTLLKKSARKQANTLNELQKIALEKTRLGIPLIFFEEGTLGGKFSGATIFPEGLAKGSTWNLGLLKEVYSAAAKEARAVGVHCLCTFVVEPVRDPRLGRNTDGFSEDPYMCSKIAEVIVRGVQGDDLCRNDKTIANLCHYPGQSEPVGGLERGAMEISERKLREVFLPPWVAGIKAGALAVMAMYPVIDDLPTHASEKLLTDILRKELNFKGVVLSEGEGFETLQYENIVSSQKEAGALAIKAGVDVNITYEDAYLKPLIENVKEGKVSMELIDRAARRVLGVKFKLGLFEKPYVDSNIAIGVMNSKEHQELTFKTAREGIVLLKNENNLLPLNKNIKSIAVIGPNVDNAFNQLGEYVAKKISQPIKSILDSIKEKVSSQTNVIYVEGCKVTGNDKKEFEKGKEAAKKSQIAIVVVGEQQVYIPGKVVVTGSLKKSERPTVGETYDVASLDLSGVQEDLIKAVYETGTPTIVVLINGRPLSIRWTAKNIPAILEAWQPGEKGGDAVADILFGYYNPSGRLSITIPYHVGQLPNYYNYKPSKRYISGINIKHWPIIEAGYVDMPMKPLYEFGYGLSYTTFKYSNFTISPKEISPHEKVEIRVDVKNLGKVQGMEVVQLYIHDAIASVSLPVMQLKGFEKINLEPGETKTVSFILASEDLALLNQDFNWVVEPGEFEIMVGSSSEKIHFKEILNVRG